jgi:peptidoglycan-associated lipoprotein
MRPISNLLVIAVALSLTAVGCKTKKPELTHIDPNETAVPELSQDKAKDESGKLNDGSQVTGENKPGGGDLATFDPDAMQQDRSAFAADTIFFDFDSAAIRSDDHSKLSAVATALQSDTSARLLVEGHCDERGTEEYNRSLGERRALAAREALVGLGVSASRIATRSYGEDRPADPGHEQPAWTKNRRDEFVLLHPK